MSYCIQNSYVCMFVFYVLQFGMDVYLMFEKSVKTCKKHSLGESTINSLLVKMGYILKVHNLLPKYRSSPPLATEHHPLLGTCADRIFQNRTAP